MALTVLTAAPEGAEKVLSRDALGFLENLCRQFNPRREELLAARAERLAARATPAQAAGLASQVDRLTDPQGMGSLFQVMAVTHPALPTPPGFPA